jgi:hypothetical protein
MTNKRLKPTKRRSTKSKKVVPIELREAGGEMQYSVVSLSYTEVSILTGALSFNFPLSNFTTLTGQRPMKITSLRAAVVSDSCPITWRLRNTLDGKTTSRCLQVDGCSPRFMHLTPNPGADYVLVTQTTDLCNIIVDIPAITTGKVTVLVEVVASVGFQFS